MDYRQIEIFELVVTLGSVTQAARRLGVTQPAVSAALAKLERAAGFTLFRREGRRLVPTPEAMLLHGKALSVLSDFRCLSETTAGIAEAPFTRAETLLRRYSFARVVVLPVGHELAAEHVLTPQLLDGKDMVTTVNSSWSWSTVERAFDAAGARCHVVAECEFTAIAINMVAAGLGLCIADPLSVAGMQGLIIRPFRPTLPYDVGVLRPAHGTLTRLAEAFAEAFHAHVAPHLIEA